MCDLTFLKWSGKSGAGWAKAFGPGTKLRVLWLDTFIIEEISGQGVWAKCPVRRWGQALPSWLGGASVAPFAILHIWLLWENYMSVLLIWFQRCLIFIYDWSTTPKNPVTLKVLSHLWSHLIQITVVWGECYNFLHFCKWANWGLESLK